MKVSLDWLREYVSLPVDLSAETLAVDLTMSTVEVEGVHHQAASLENVYVGRVQELKPHPDADRLQIVTTDIGTGVHEIVCGGSNVRVGMLVAVGVPGSQVRWHGEGELITLKESKVRGVKSYGMICAACEIGLAELFPAEDEAEIVDLSEYEVAVGTPLADALGLTDTIIEIDNKSLTNRPDLWGHYGIARELSAIYDVPLAPLVDFKLPDKSDSVAVHIASDKCFRYTAATIESVENTDSPLWLKRRLSSVGQRSIDLIVDLTNYVMFALGQPLHAFDAKDVSAIEVRHAKERETLTLLDNTELELNENDLLITDGTTPVALAGVMGGADSGVSASTTTVVLEAAAFDATSVRKTASRYSLRTESSMRFEKGLNTSRVKEGAVLFLHLLSELQPSIRCTGWTDMYPAPTEKVSISVSTTFINSRIGAELPIRSPLERLGFLVVSEGDEHTITVPEWRATGDVSLPEDIVEEVARLHGYDNFRFNPISIQLEKPVFQPQVQLERRIREFLAYSGGMQEVFNYPWVDEQLLEATGTQNEDFVSLADPPAPSMSKLARSLVPNLIAIAKKNIHEILSFRLFEVAQVFFPIAEKANSLDQEVLPEQPVHLAGVIAGAQSKETFLEAKGILEAMFDTLAVDSLRFQVSDVAPSWAARDACLRIFAGAQDLGCLALVSASTLTKAGFGRGKLAIFEIDLTRLAVRPKKAKKYTTLAKYPNSKYDLAVLFDSDKSWQEVERVVKKASPLIAAVHFVDEYKGSQVPEGKKSLAFQMVLEKKDGTLTSQESQAVAEVVLKQLADTLGGNLRSE